MKKILFFLLSISSVCFGYTADMLFHTDEAKNIFNFDDRMNAIVYLNWLIDSPLIPDVDKVHYLLLKHQFIAPYGDRSVQCSVCKQIDDLCKSNYLCYLEVKYAYDIDNFSD
jgi:hypothetical protein